MPAGLDNEVHQSDQVSYIEFTAWLHTRVDHLQNFMVATLFPKIIQQHDEELKSIKLLRILGNQVCIRLRLKTRILVFPILNPHSLCKLRDR